MLYESVSFCPCYRRPAPARRTVRGAGGAGPLHRQRAEDRDTDRVLTSGLRLAADPDAAEDALRRMYHIVETEKHRVAPNCAICTMRCGNTDNYDLARLWAAPEDIRALKLRLLAAVFRLAQGRPDACAQEVIDQALFVLAEDWDEELLAPVVKRAEDRCAG